MSDKRRLERVDPNPKGDGRALTKAERRAKEEDERRSREEWMASQPNCRCDARGRLFIPGS